MGLSRRMFTKKFKLAAVRPGWNEGVRSARWRGRWK